MQLIYIPGSTKVSEGNRDAFGISAGGQLA